MRIRVQAYGPSNSARALAKHLGIKLLRQKGSTFRARATDVIINWGVIKTYTNANYINPISAVITASNKLTTLLALQAAEVSTPVFDTNCTFADDSSIVVARTTLSGHSGQGIVVGEPNQLPHAPLYTEFIDKKREYRAIVCIDEVVDFKQKLKKKDWDGERSPYVWNVANGYVFARNEITRPESIDQLAIDAVKALGLKYGAVDIIEDCEGKLYVLEVNTAFGLEGATIALFGNKIKQYLEEL